MDKYAEMAKHSLIQLLLPFLSHIRPYKCARALSRPISLLKWNDDDTTPVKCQNTIMLWI